MLMNRVKYQVVLLLNLKVLETSSCFEYRTDGDVSQRAENDGKNYNAEITDGLYPYVCVKNNMKSKAINANQYIEIRLSFGAER